MAAQVKIPQELLEMLRERRLIPFIGAGFSVAHGLPDWDTMLRQVSSEVADVPDYDVIKDCCNGDHLQIAEYLFIKSDRSIGPLRHKLSTLLQTRTNCLDSTQHVELVNLNLQQIYTTNYDETIEQTYQELEHPYAFVALPKHIAGSNKWKTQVVKYHGDLRYDQSLVLTESSYYNRLEFESPMDLKFRSDLLGQSVMFIGYSFRDINIRIIWFKLMEMMRDVPESDRPTSYIVRFERNEVLEDLYKAVGIKTICLDPNGTANTNDERTRMLGGFMLDLAASMSGDGYMPQSTTPMYLSKGLIEAIQNGISTKRRDNGSSIREADSTRAYVEHAAQRQVPSSLAAQLDDFFAYAARTVSRPDILAAITKWAVKRIHSSNPNLQGAYFAIIRGMLRNVSREVAITPSSKAPWSKIWATKLSDTNAEALVKYILSEFEHHGSFVPDADTAYAADIAIRITQKHLSVSVEKFEQLSVMLKEPLESLMESYPALCDIVVTLDKPTDLSKVIEQFEAANPHDEIPF